MRLRWPSLCDPEPVGRSHGRIVHGSNPRLALTVVRDGHLARVVRVVHRQRERLERSLERFLEGPARNKTTDVRPLSSRRVPQVALNSS